jgi:flagellar biosynthesis anti-sigma factor FlgM
MKVQNKVGTPVKADTSSGIGSAGSSRKSKAAADLFATDVKSSARVDLSERAQDTKKATELAKKGLVDVDEAKVAKFQALIDAGKYQIDASKVADRMVDEHLSNELAAQEAKE